MDDKIKNICIKYLMYDANIEELEILENWLKKSKNKQLFANYLKINYAMDININPFDTQKSISNFLEEIRKNQQNYKRRKLIRAFRYTVAAVLVGILTTTYFYRGNLFGSSIENVPTITEQDIIVPGTDKATLILEDGSRIVLEKGKSIQTKNANSNGKKLIYKADRTKKTEIVYNDLIVPRGGKFSLTLADGTKVSLNSETYLKYPVNFVDGTARKVEVVYGEAYFEVSPSKNHKGSRFKVIKGSHEIEVSGTEFNIKAYRDEKNIYTTLAEGNVSIKVDGKTKDLKPSQQSNFDLSTKDLTIRTVDVYNEISWKDGIFSFEDKSLQDIMKVLSRWFDMEVVFENENIKNEAFFGLIRKDQNIEKIISSIKEYGIIKEYELNDKVLIIK